MYAVKIDKLISVDLDTRKVEQFEGAVESFSIEDGRLYAIVSMPRSDDWFLRVCDFDTQSYHDIATTKPIRIQLSGGITTPPPLISPDKKWLAYFSPTWSNNVSLRYQLQVVSVESGTSGTCGDPLPAREWGTGAGDVSVGPPFMWLTSKIILVVRDDSKELYSETWTTSDGVEMNLAAVDIESGRMTNIMRLPKFQPGIGEPWFPPVDGHGAPHIVLGTLGQYRVDLTARGMTKDDGLRGPYRYHRENGWSELLFGAKQLGAGEAIPQVAVSPDGQSVAWEVHSSIRFHTLQAKDSQTVATEWIPEVYQQGYKHSLEGNLLWFTSSDLAQKSAAPLASGWTAFPLAK